MSVSVGRKTTKASPHIEDVPTRLFLWSASVGVLAFALPGAGRLLDGQESLLELGLWAAIVAAVDLAPVRVWKSVSVSMSFPVTLAAGMIFLPTEAALVSFLGSFDPRELRGDVTLAKSVFNRSQVAASVMAGSALFHGLGGSVMEWPAVFVPGLLALLLDALVNSALVVAAVSIQNRLTPVSVVTNMFGGSPIHYVAGFLLLGILALPMSASVAVGGVWALLLFLSSLVLAREMFRQRQAVIRASEAIRRKDAALLGVAGEAARERKEERLSLAGELHDEVLPSLFKVHLMGQVLRQDLARGRLFELDEDLPELLSATEDAQRAIRDLLGDLRRSPIGPDGLRGTVEILVDQLTSAGSPPISADVAEDCGTPLSQLLAYQVAREALHNAAKHSKASRIRLIIRSDELSIRVAVSDDGVGFEPQGIDRDRHFGLQIMAERLEAAGGHVIVDSTPNVGTTVAAVIPLDL
jgi:signal transduction histidine kinase